jgi:mono/diheme cytochrome c family protein
MAPALAESPLVTGDPAVLALAVLKGIAKENGAYLAAMAPMAAAISDDAKLAALLTYLRNSFDNSAPAVTAEEAAKYRTRWQDEKGPVTRARLKELSDQAAAAAKKE